MLKTTTVTELRAALAAHLAQVREGPLLVLSHSRPAAVLLDPELFDTLMEKVELLEDLLDGQRVLDEVQKTPRAALEAEAVFERLGH